MITLTFNPFKYEIEVIPPDGTDYISYTVSIGGNQVFSGGGKYFGERYLLDCMNWIEDYINDHLDSEITSVTVTVVFTFNDGTSQTKTLTWTAYTFPSLSMPCSNVYLTLSNCGFVAYNSNNSVIPVVVPLATVNGYLDGKTINNLDKINSIDKWGNIIPGSTTNHYELECYVDPDCLNIETGKDLVYENVMLALQNAKSIYLSLNGNNISGMVNTSGISGFNVHVKDVEKIETYSSYSTNKKVPSLKITLEVFNS